MRKATYKDIPTYCHYKRCMDTKGNKGYLYHLREKLSDSDKDMLKEKYNNVDFYVAINKYAQEVKHDVIFLSDKVMKN